MPATTLNELVTPIDAASALTTELSIATGLGLPVTAWQPLGIGRSILGINAQIVSGYSSTINLIAQGGYLTYAALMVDASGVPITSWMDLVGQNVYNVTREEASFAEAESTGFSVTNSSSTPQGPYSPGALHFENPVTGKTYTNTGTVTLVGSGTNGGVTPLAIIADEAGSASSSGVGTITSIVSPTLPNCTCTNSAALVGTDAESNGAYETRCLAKLGALSPNGSAQAYYFVATSITDATQPFYNAGVLTAITRCTVVTAPGEVNVYIANAAGAVSGCVQNPVTGATNANPIEITTSSAHDLSSGDYAIISGVGGNTAANGQFLVTVTGSNTFTIDVAGNGVYTSGGIVEGGDLGLVDAAIQRWAVPDGVTAVVASATPHAVDITATIYIPGTAGLTATEVTTAGSDAIATYLEALPIGGVTDANTHRVPYSALLGVLYGANRGTTAVTLSVPSADVALAANEVATQGTTSIAVVFV